VCVGGCIGCGLRRGRPFESGSWGCSGWFEVSRDQKQPYGALLDEIRARVLAFPPPEIRARMGGCLALAKKTPGGAPVGRCAINYQLPAAWKILRPPDTLQICIITS
jgi:hypothetical protein